MSSENRDLGVPKVHQVGKRQFEAAQGLLEGILRTRESDPQLQYALGSVLYLEGHLSDAAAHFAESVRLQPDQLASYYYLALVVRDEGKDAEAIQRLRALLQRFLMQTTFRATPGGSVCCSGECT